ncbi:MAG: hypothetical protein Q8N81_01035, partial [bacterium]|nr:hypothetical protein [bacterium]
ALLSQEGFDVVIHKIAGLGDEVYDDRSYVQACDPVVKNVNKRYEGIMKFDLLDSDYKENKTAPPGAYRRSMYTGGQYSCLLGGKYEQGKKQEVGILSGEEFSLKEFPEIKFSYPVLEGYKNKITYNGEKKAGQILYSRSSFAKDYDPAIIIERFDSRSNKLSGDKTFVNPQGIEYKIWSDYGVPTDYFFKDPFENEDTTIEMVLSPDKVFQITTANFIHSGILEAPVIDYIVKSFAIRQ